MTMSGIRLISTCWMCWTLATSVKTPQFTISAADTGMISNDAATIPWNYPFAESRRSYAMSGGGGGSYSVMAELI